MRTQPNEPVHPQLRNVHGQDTGLTKREYFATHLNLHDYQMPEAIAEELMGEKMPVKMLDKIRFSIRLQARIRVMTADALIKELNK